MSHNHEPDKAARRHKPAIIAIAVALLAALLAFWIFRPGVPEEGGDGLANTPPPASMPLGDAEGRSDETAPPVTPSANTPADSGVPAGTVDPPSGATAPGETAPSTAPGVDPVTAPLAN